MTPAQRRLAFIKEKEVGASVSSICRKYKISRFTFYKWYKIYQKEKNLENRYKKGSQHWRATSEEIERIINDYVIAYPDFSVDKLHKFLRKKGLKIGRHGLQNYLTRNKITTKKEREILQKQYFIKPIDLSSKLDPEFRLLFLQKAAEDGENISSVCRRFNISRFTFYKWLRRLKAEEINLKAALYNRFVKGYTHWKSIPEYKVNKLLDLVILHPEYSVSRLYKEVGDIGRHGIQNILERKNLNNYQKRLSFSRASQEVLQPATSKPASLPIYNMALRLYRMLIAPFVTIPKILFSQQLSLYFFATFLTTFLFSLYWISILKQAQSPSQLLGFIFASIALTVGTFFFLYSMKYYITIALVLGFSRQTKEDEVPQVARVPRVSQESRVSRGEEARGTRDTLDSRSTFIDSLINKILGREIRGERKSGSKVFAGGLQPDLSKITLEREPFVSIHLASYNEKRVIDRLLTAATSMDYENYEVILVDDSSDKEAITKVSEWKGHPRLKIIQRKERTGFKGGALEEARKATNPKAEFVLVFDADFIPYPDSITQFLKYFKAVSPADKLGNLSDLSNLGNIAAVQGYQWHVLNKSENWITRGVRSEYAGSYVVERSGAEIYSGLKQISGSVYMIKRKILDEIKWGVSITEDFELTLNLYAKGYKVVYTPYVQAPSECVSTIKRLIRQRMRWAEGHSHNIKLKFLKLLKSPKLSTSEKFEFFYLAPYYLQSAFFLVGTFSWFLAEVVFKTRLPFWTAVWGWSLVLTNMFSLPLMNMVGLFLEESEEKDYLGLLSFVILSYILAPFQAYASVKGFLESEEGPWFRTPKTGKITDIFERGRFYRWLSGILPFRPGVQPSLSVSSENKELLEYYFNTYGEIPKEVSNLSSLSHLSLSILGNLSNLNKYLSLATANNRFDNFKIMPNRRRIRWVSKVFLVILLLVSNLLISFAPNVPYFVKPENTKAQGFGLLNSPENTVNQSQNSSIGNKITQNSINNNINNNPDNFPQFRKELIDKRTKYSKSFEEMDGKITIENHQTPIHYQDREGKWQEISSKAEELDNSYQFNQGSVKFTVSKNEPEIGITTSSGDNIKFKYLNTNITYGKEKDNTIVYSNIWENTDLEIKRDGEFIKENIILKDKGHPQEFQFVIETELETELTQIGDILLKKEGKIVGKFRRYFIEVAEKQEDRLLATTKNGDIYSASLPNISDLKYPIIVDPTFNEGASADDCDEQAATAIYLTGLNLVLGRASSINWNNGFRFINITIPQGATINSAVISYKARYANTDTTVDISYYGNNVDDAATFSTVADYDGRTKTTATVNQTFSAWTADTWYSSVELKTIVQEIVNRANWVSGNDIAFLTSRISTFSNQKPYSIDYSAANAPYIVISYYIGTQVDTTTSATPTAYSFQRKTWWDGTRYWVSFYSLADTRAEFWYSTNGVTWTENTAARLSGLTFDFSVEATASGLLIAYKNGYDVQVQSANNLYPATDFSWYSATTVYDGSGATDTFSYPTISWDTNNKAWVASVHLSGSNYLFKAAQASNSYSVAAWASASTLDTSANSNKYGVIVPRTSGAMYAVWIDNAAIEGDSYNGAAWSGSPAAIDTGLTGLTNNMSAVTDYLGNVHLLYIDQNNKTLYKEFTTSWQAAVTLDSTAGSDYASISLDTDTNNLYAIWIRADVMYYKKGVSPYASGNWDASASTQANGGTNVYATSNYSGARVFVIWSAGAASPYSVRWGLILIPERLVLFLGLGFLIPAYFRKRKRRKL